MGTVTLKINDRVTISAEGDNTTAIFDELVKLQETFADFGLAHKKIDGKMCYDDKVMLRSREVEGNVYREMYAPKLKAKLEFGIKQKDAHLYPKRVETDGKGKSLKEDGKTVYRPDNGWMVWDSELKKNV